MADQKVVNLLKRNIVTTLFITGSIFISGGFINLAQLLIHLFVKPFSYSLFQKLMYYLCWSWLSQWSFLISFWSNSDTVLHCKQEDLKYLGKEHTFALINHTYEIDWLFSWALLDSYSALGNGRTFLKKEMLYFPIAGWFLKLSGNVFLERDYEKDKEVIEKQIKTLMHYDDPSWIVFTAEGTRFSQTKHEASVKFAEERKLIPLKYHLIPRPKGFVTCVPLLQKHKCPSILNMQLCIDKKSDVKPTLGNIMQAKKVTCHIYIERIPMDKVEASPEFLQKLFQEKDILQDCFQTFGNFTESRKLEPLKSIKLKPRACVLFNNLAWMSFNLSTLLYIAYNLLAKGQFITFTAVFGSIISLFYFMTRKMLNASSVAKASAYGKTK